MRRSTTVAAATAAALVSLAGPAAAHVTVNPRTAEQGSYTKVAFRVPNERDDAKTTQLQVDLPLDHPVVSVSVRPVSGWKIDVRRSELPAPIKQDGGELTEAVSTIVWSGGQIEPGRFEEFDVSLGPLPTGTDRMVFKAVQTYSGGEVVRWDEDPGTGGAEPEHPAPVLTLTPAGQSAGQGTGPGRSPAAVLQAVQDDDSDGTARLLGGLGLAVGAAGIVIGGLGLLSGRARREERS